MPHWLFRMLGLTADTRGVKTLTSTRTTTRTVVALGVAGAAIVAAAAFGIAFSGRRPAITSITQGTGIAIAAFQPCTSVSVTAGAAVTATRATNAPIGSFQVTASPARCAMDVTALTVNVTSNVSLTGVTANTITAWAGDVTAGQTLGSVTAVTWGRHTITFSRGRRLVFDNAPLTITVTANTSRATAGQYMTASVTSVTSRPPTSVTAAPVAGVTARPSGIIAPVDVTAITGVTSVTWITGPDWNTAVTAARVTY